MRKLSDNALPIALSVAAISLLLCCGCRDKLAECVRQAATGDQWQAWAAEISDRHRNTGTNRDFVEIPRSDVPDFVRRIPPPNSEWLVYVYGGDSNLLPRVSIISLGGFGSAGIEIGPSNFVDVPGPQARTARIYPGVYVRETF